MGVMDTFTYIPLLYFKRTLTLRRITCLLRVALTPTRIASFAHHLDYLSIVEVFLSCHGAPAALYSLADSTPVIGILICHPRHRLVRFADILFSH